MIPPRTSSSLIHQVHHTPAAVTVALTGEFTHQQVPGIHAELVRICEQRPPRLVVDLSGVTHLDSSGVSALVEIYRRLNRYGGEIRLAGMNSMVRGIFEITKLDQIFSIFSTSDEALKA